MTTKDKHVIMFWYAKAKKKQEEKGGPISAGELGRFMGMSTKTARSWLKRMAGEGLVSEIETTFPNKTTGFTYSTERVR